MRVVRRRDGAMLPAEITADHATSCQGAPVLLIAGEAYGPAELAGYVVAEATAAECAELRRGGYDLRQTTSRE